ncbi:hypothetical protein As57867_007043, partial [Aphanomyces stellatus]
MTAAAPAWQCLLMSDALYAAVRTETITGDLECIALTEDGSCAMTPSLFDCEVTIQRYLASPARRLSTFRPPLAPNAYLVPKQKSNTTTRDDVTNEHAWHRMLVAPPDAPATVAPPPSNNDGVSSTVVWIISISVACVVLISWILFLLYRRKQADRERCISKAYVNMMDTSADEHPPVNLSFLELYRLDSSAVTLGQLLGSGGFADVFRGTLHGTPVAVKTLFENHPTRRELQTFATEVQLMAVLHSPFIVDFIGVAWDTPEDLKCILEYMDLGDLRDYLATHDAASFSWPCKLTCIQSIAEGLVYLHDASIIHRDLKSRNVLLDSTKGTKLSDFGFSREQTTNTMTAGVGTYRWMAPEVILAHR